MTFWLNGAFRDDATAIDIADRGFLLGDGVFETILLTKGSPAFLAAHLTRMRAGAAALGIDARIIDADIAAAISEVVRRNQLADVIASARLTLTRGVGPRGLAIGKGPWTPSLLLTTGAYEPPAADAPPASVVVSAHRRNEASVTARWKTLNYLDNVLAKEEASAAGADDAVMLNAAGRVACASAANIFLLHDGAAITPPVSEGAMPGIVRAALIDAAKGAGISIVERPATAAELQWSPLMLTNSLIGLRAATMRGGPAFDAAARRVLDALKLCYARALERDRNMQGRP